MSISIRNKGGFLKKPMIDFAYVSDTKINLAGMHFKSHKGRCSFFLNRVIESYFIMMASFGLMVRHAWLGFVSKIGGGIQISLEAHFL